MRRDSRSGFVKVRRRAGIFAGQVLTDLRPALAAIRGLVEKLIREIERVRIGWRENKRLRPCVTILIRPSTSLRRDIPGFASNNVAARDRAAEKNFSMKWIRRRVAGFAAGTSAGPIMHGNL